MATNKKTVASSKVSLEDVIDCEATNDKLDLKKTTSGQVRIEDSALINVKSNVFGELTYVDKRTMEEFKWPRCGSIQQVPFSALRSMKATSISFYENQWIIITGFADEHADKYTPADIYKSLAIGQYYKDLIEPSDYATICSWSPDEIKSKVSLMSNEAKANLAVALNMYIEKGILDSLKRIKAFEMVLGCELKMPE